MFKHMSALGMAVVILAASAALAIFSSSNLFLLYKPTPAAGGGETASPSYNLASLTGQTATGRTASAGYTMDHGFYGETGLSISAVNENAEALPATFRLGAVYPNPFNPVTTVVYELPRRSHTVLKIYNMKGQLVRALLDEERPAGRSEIVWNGQNDSGAPVASGLYLLKMNAGNFVAGRKITLLK